VILENGGGAAWQRQHVAFRKALAFHRLQQKLKRLDFEYLQLKKMY
jgi:hypothetical protein